MRKRKSKLENLPIRIVLIIMLFPFFLFLIICCGIFCMAGGRHYSNLVMENTRSIVEQSRDALNQDIKYVRETVEGLVASKYFYSMDANLKNNENPIAPADYLQLSNNITDFMRNYSVYVEYAGMYLSNNSIYYWRSNTGTTDQGFMRGMDEKQYGIYPTLEWISLERLNSDFSESKIPSQFGLIKMLGDTESKVNGFVLMGIRDELFFNQIQNSRLTPNSSLAFITNDGQIISGDSVNEKNTFAQITESDINEILEQIKNISDTNVISFEVHDWYMVYTPIIIEDIGILAVIPTEELNMSYRGFTYVLLFFVLAVLILFLILYYVIPAYISRPVTRLLRQMEEIRNLEDAGEIKVAGYQEISRIGTGINTMIERIRGLTESIQREMTAKQATQLQYLFAQINPHFLYNTLDCIKELCACNEISKAEEMLDQLVVFYRIGVSKGKSFITIGDEIRHVSSYLAILQTRYEDFQFCVELPKELEHCVTLRMIIQPIVENAVYHGLRPYRTDGMVTIRVVRVENKIEYHIIDNGAGFSEDILEKVKKSLNEPICNYTEKSYGVYGLKNIQDRIQLAYGDYYKIQVASEEDCGTEIVLTIPYEEKHK